MKLDIFTKLFIKHRKHKDFPVTVFAQFNWVTVLNKLDINCFKIPIYIVLRSGELVLDDNNLCIQIYVY